MRSQSSSRMEKSAINLSVENNPAKKMSLRVLAVPVAFNEEKKIGSVLDRFEKDLVDEVLVMDDGSTDRTPEIVRQKGVRLLSHDQRKGVGAAIRSAIKYARKNAFDVIVILAGND